MLIHRKLSLDEISTGLELLPTNGWSVGDVAPKGVRPSIRAKTFWYQRSRVDGVRFFAKSIEIMIENLSARTEFTRGFQESGGTIRIDLALPGSINIGDELSPSLLRKISDIRVGLGIEVFPGLKAHLDTMIQIGESNRSTSERSDSIEPPE